MMKMTFAAIVLLLAVDAQAASRDLLATTCNPQTRLECKGKCVRFLTDKNNCGSCGNKCKNGNICVNGGCVCPANQYECYNKCTDVMTDNMNCGYCGNVCPGACKDGQCVGGDDGCGIAQKRCGGVCKNIFVDNANCGNCGVACKNGNQCNGEGGCTCPANKPDQCGKPGVCTNKQTDKNNCGFCGNKCKGNKKCVKGGCK